MLLSVLFIVVFSFVLFRLLLLVKVFCLFVVFVFCVCLSLWVVVFCVMCYLFVFVFAILCKSEDTLVCCVCF